MVPDTSPLGTFFFSFCTELERQRQGDKEDLGEVGLWWLSQLNIRLLILAHVMFSHGL